MSKNAIALDGPFDLILLIGSEFTFRKTYKDGSYVEVKCRVTNVSPVKSDPREGDNDE